MRTATRIGWMPEGSVFRRWPVYSVSLLILGACLGAVSVTAAYLSLGLIAAN